MEFYDSKDEPAPLIFYLLMKEISNTLFSKEIPKDVMKLFEGKSQVVDELIRKEVAGENSAWFTKYGGFTKVVHTSYENVMKKLQKEYNRMLESGSGAITINSLLHIQFQNHLVC